ncbi:DUF5339 family protein [Citrobacter amalonaticus]|uniref:DUF5339 family protein n=1 Tax=Citrobacter amalonaticus TaxID=35703 RepID=UPI00287AE240|nr:DUF5339 family protein [Citrobacter amalonaticus]MDS4036816.1 DUF5339 family protein [Citrobacter amalonaticus]
MMMKKMVLAAVMLSGSAVVCAAETGPECSNYFKMTEDYLALAADGAAGNAAMKGQIDTLRTQYEAAKKQLQAQPAEAQEQSCKQAVGMMEQMVKQMEGMKK